MYCCNYSKCKQSFCSNLLHCGLCYYDKFNLNFWKKCRRPSTGVHRTQTHQHFFQLTHIDINLFEFNKCSNQIRKNLWYQRTAVCIFTRIRRYAREKNVHNSHTEGEIRMEIGLFEWELVNDCTTKKATPTTCRGMIQAKHIKCVKNIKFICILYGERESDIISWPVNKVKEWRCEKLK